MCKTRVSIVVVLAVVGVAAGYVQPTGKCNTYRIQAKPIDYDKLYKLGRWNILYVPDAEPFRQLDHAYVEVTLNNDESYRVVVTRVAKDNSTSSQVFKQRYIDNVIAEVSGHGTHNYTHQHNYPIASLSNKAFLIYRCSDNGRLQIDTRYIIILAGNELNETELRELFEVDKKYNFSGSLYKLPYDLA